MGWWRLSKAQIRTSQVMPGHNSRHVVRRADQDDLTTTACFENTCKGVGLGAFKEYSFNTNLNPAV